MPPEPEGRPAPSLSPWLLAAAGAPALVLLAGIALATGAPEHYRVAAQEDGWIEWATVLTFATAAALAAVAGLRRPPPEDPSPRLTRLALLGLAAFCVFVAGEEISWGQRLLAFRPPTLFLESNYQQEANLHNLLKNVFDSRWQVASIAGGYGVLAPLLAPQAWFPRPLAPNRAVAPASLLVVVLEVTYPFDLAGELAELSLGLIFVVDASLRCAAGHAARGARRAVLAQLAALSAAAAFAPLVDWTVGGGADERVAAARAEIDRLGRDLADDANRTDELSRKTRVHKRLFTAAREGYVRFGDRSELLEGRRTPAEGASETARTDRLGYFLDPWNQPYWLLYESVGDTRGLACVYSFGKNRRRDSALDEDASGDRVELVDDDIGVCVPVERARPFAP